MKKVSRLWIIRQLCRKEYGAKRPTAIQINAVIKKYGLNLYGSDGRKRTKEAIGKALSKAVALLKS